MEIQQFYYLLVNFCCLIVPFVFSFHPKLDFYKKWKAFFPAVAGMMLVFIPWDMYFTLNGIWGFNTTYTTGIFLFNLPIEEWLFFICIPYASVFTYHCMVIFVDGNRLKYFSALSWIIAIASLFIAIYHFDRWYTFTAHLLCGVLLIYHLIRKSTFLPHFTFTFLILLVPMIISNGILTGLDFWRYPFFNSNPSNVSDMIVWYDNNHNLSFRLFSMPVDDIAYGFAMLLLTVTLYEEIAAKRRRH